MNYSEFKSEYLPDFKKRIIKHGKSSLNYIYVFIKWIFIASVVGFIGGIVGTLFNLSISYATQLRMSSPFPLVVFLPLGGLVIVGCYKLCRVPSKIDTNMVLRSVRTDSVVTIFIAPLIFLGSVITHLFGGSAGREGAALQLGGSIGGALGKILKLDKRDMHVITLCGMASVFSALFGAPLTATFFAMEVISIGIIYYSGLVPCLTASITAYAVSMFSGASPVRFNVKIVPDAEFGVILRVVLLAVLCAVISIVFCVTMHKTAKLFAKLFKNEFIRIAVGGALVALLTFVLRTGDYNGIGSDVINRAFDGNARPEAFVLKIIFTALTIGSGFKGGEIVPTFFIGSTFGCIIGGLIGLNPGFAAAIGLAAVFCGVVNCPVASIMLCLELFGSNGILLYAVAVAVSYMLSGYYGLYKGQKIVYSKLKNQYINIHAK